MGFGLTRIADGSSVYQEYGDVGASAGGCRIPAQAQNLTVGYAAIASVILEGNMVVITADMLFSSQYQNSGMIVLSEGAQLRNRLPSMAMTAMSANMKVGIWVLGHCAPTSYGRPGSPTICNSSNSPGPIGIRRVSAPHKETDTSIKR